MLLKKYHKCALSLFISFVFLISGSNLKADVLPSGGGYTQGGAYVNGGGYAGGGGGYQGMWGTGYYGGVQGCTGWKQGTGAIDMSDDEKAERKAISEAALALEKMKLDKKRADQEMEIARRKIERVFDSSISEFLLDVHIDLMNECSMYKDVGVAKPAATTSTTTTATTTATTTCTTVDANGNEIAQTDNALCGGKTDIPDKLKGKWILPGNQGYCTATSKSAAGNVSSKICADKDLRPEDASKYRSYSTSECGKALGDYKKSKLKSDKAQAKIEQLNDEIEDRKYAIADAKERAKLEAKYKQSNTTETDCPECDAASRGATYTKKQRDWGSILGQIGIGLGLGFLGKKYDDRNAEYSAQLGYPPQQGYPTAVSMGVPYILGGVYGAINGTSGQGGYGCGAGLNGTGGVYGAGNGMNGPFGGAGGVYGPYANMGGGGAFGYPQGMYGTPWGGGMYMPGYGAGGMLAGPWGGIPGGVGNGGYAMSAMINGGYMMGGGAGGYMMGGGGYMGNMINGGYMSGGYMAGGGGYMMNGGGGGGYMMNGGGGYMSNGGYMMNGGAGYMVSGGLMMNGGGGYMMGNMMNGGGGYMMNGGGGYMMGNMMGGNGGYMMNGGGYQGMGMMIPNQAMSNGGYMQSGYMQTGAMTNGQYQLQMMQMQQQMQQQAMQQQMQYQQAQMQAQMQAYQQQMAVQQQAQQVQQEIASLQVRLQMLYSGAYTSNSTYNTGTIPYPTGTVNPYPSGTLNPTGTMNPYPTGTLNPTGTVVPTGSQITVPTNGR